MNHHKFFKKTAFLFILTLFCLNFAFAQTANSLAPRENQLLNGLKVLVWSDKNAEKVTIKLRVHSGSAFDPKDKMGVMAMLADSLFPTAESKAFFTEDLEGSLELSATYDYLQITATGKSSEILSMLETISTAVINTPLTPENFKLISEARLNKVKELEKNPAYIADLAVAKRLLGEFPYGRSLEGTPESVAKIDRADLLFAKERFLTADNATLAVSGNVKPEYVYRVARQLFGGWTKSEKKVPATFRIPNSPVTEKVVFNTNLVDKSETRYAFRNLARTDKDYFAQRFLVDILTNRQILADDKSKIFVKNERNLLSSLMIIGVSNLAADVANANEKAKTVKELFGNKLFTEITPTEFEQTRSKILAEIEQKSTMDKWLDIDSFRLGSVKDEMQKLNSVTLVDVQRVAEKLANQPFVTIVLVKPTTTTTPTN